jgi:hypothetical protein
VAEPAPGVLASCADEQATSTRVGSGTTGTTYSNRSVTCISQRLFVESVTPQAAAVAPLQCQYRGTRADHVG